MRLCLLLTLALVATATLAAPVQEEKDTPALPAASPAEGPGDGEEAPPPTAEQTPPVEPKADPDAPSVPAKDGDEQQAPPPAKDEDAEKKPAPEGDKVKEEDEKPAADAAKDKEEGDEEDDHGDATEKATEPAITTIIPSGSGKLNVITYKAFKTPPLKSIRFWWPGERMISLLLANKSCLFSRPEP